MIDQKTILLKLDFSLYSTLDSRYTSLKTASLGLPRQMEFAQTAQVVSTDMRLVIPVNLGVSILI